MSDFLQEPPPGRASGLSSWGERLAVVRSVVTPGRVVRAVVGAVAAVFFGVVFLRTPSHPPELVLPKAGDPPPAAAPAAPAGVGPGAGSVPAGGAGGGAATTVVGGGVGVVTVHAAGQVSAPGVYSVPAGARIADLVTAAGGLLPEADIDRLNLAARVVDGTRVYIPRKGETPPPEAAAGDPGAGAGATGGAAGGGGAGAAAGPVDLNTATAAQLDTLPGVGPATAAAILTYRTRHGRFKSVTELLEVPGIGPSKLEAIRPLVVVS
ncbi:MAG TPA: helix-hairpin-helix domain-containing protein [Acidimicrobiales bacterium]|nr:helix-hairpin-helix domain-containing protein [Acidimicrobiales bacterium]